MQKKSLFILFGAPFVLCGCLATQSDVGVLKTQVAELNKTLQTLQSTQAEAVNQSGELMDNLVRTNENLSEFDFKLNEISTKLDNIISVGGASMAGMLPGEIFAQARKQYDGGDYSHAVKGFELYIKNAPEGASVEDAYLLCARSYYALENFKKAAVQAATLLDKYPQSKLTAAARVEYAKSILRLEKKDEAQAYLKSVTQDFKDSPEAAEAAEILKGIK